MAAARAEFAQLAETTRSATIYNMAGEKLNEESHSGEEIQQKKVIAK